MSAGDFLIVGQPWRAVGIMDEQTDHLTLNIFCSEFVLKFPSISTRTHISAASACAYIESLPFMSYSTFANSVFNPSSRDSKQSSAEPKLNSVSSFSGVGAPLFTKLCGLGHEGVVLATASKIDYESGICSKDLIFCVPVASVFFPGYSRGTVCYCSPEDFHLLSEQLVEKNTYSFKGVVKEAFLSPHGFYPRAFIQSRSVQLACSAEDDDVVQNIPFGMDSRCSLHLQYSHQFSFQSRLVPSAGQFNALLRPHALFANILVPENGHGFCRFRFLNSPVFGCIIGFDGNGSPIPIFMTSRHVADSMFASLSCRTAEIDADVPQKPWILFERLNLVCSTLKVGDDDAPSIALADGFTKLVVHPCSPLAPNTTSTSDINKIMMCDSQSVVILDSFYNGGDQMCPKCQSTCSVVDHDCLCRHCGFCGLSQCLSSGYLPLYLLVTDPKNCVPSTQVLQIRSGALSSFIAQYIGRCLSWSGHEAGEALRDSLLFCNSLAGKKIQCCILADVCLDESVIMFERCPRWVSESNANRSLREVLKVSIE